MQHFNGHFQVVFTFKIIWSTKLKAKPVTKQLKTTRFQMLKFCTTDLNNLIETVHCFLAIYEKKKFHCAAFERKQTLNPS